MKLSEPTRCEHQQPTDECEAGEVLEQLSRQEEDWDSVPLTYWQELEEDLRPLMKDVG